MGVQLCWFTLLASVVHASNLLSNNGDLLGGLSTNLLGSNPTNAPSQENTVQKPLLDLNGLGLNSKILPDITTTKENIPATTISDNIISTESSVTSKSSLTEVKSDDTVQSVIETTTALPESIPSPTNFSSPLDVQEGVTETDPADYEDSSYILSSEEDLPSAGNSTNSTSKAAVPVDGGRRVIDVPSKPCKPGMRRDKHNRCRKVFGK